MNFNAANRKDIRIAEKAAAAAVLVDREVICGLMSVKNGRHWVYNQLAEAQVFADPFSTDPSTHAYLAGLRAQGIRLFNLLVLYAADNFTLMIQEANERSATDAARRSAGTSGRSDSHTGPDSFADAIEPEPTE